MSNINKIDCSVHNCVYHDKTNNCTAGHVNVGKCVSDTTECDDTKCSTFKLKENMHWQKDL